jgi:hypothetical protein
MASGKGQERTSAIGTKSSKLPYSVELWDIEKRAVERLLARAASASLARAIFSAAQEEHPDRRLTLSRGERVIAQSG